MTRAAAISRAHKVWATHGSRRLFLVRRYDTISLTGILSPEAAREILESGREALRVKET